MQMLVYLQFPVVALAFPLQEVDFLEKLALMELQLPHADSLFVAVSETVSRFGLGRGLCSRSTVQSFKPVSVHVYEAYYKNTNKLVSSSQVDIAETLPDKQLTFCTQQERSPLMLCSGSREFLAAGMLSEASMTEHSLALRCGGAF